jgi:glycosyltransferase involved in cell wall biosynthesis
MRICMFVKNSFEYDARVTKEARTLVAAGHEVTVVALRAGHVTPPAETTSYGARVVRVRRAEFGLGRLTRRLSRAAARAVVTEAAARGTAVDESRLDEARLIQPPSTAAPGAGITAPADPAGRTGRMGVVRSRVTLGAVRVVRGVLSVVRRLLAGPVRLAKNAVVNARMRSAGMETAADVFHAHDLNTLWVAVRCAGTLGGSVVYDSHELATERSRMGRFWRRWATVTERRWLRRVDALIVASPVWLGLIAAKHGRLPAIAESVINAPEATEVVPLDVRAEVGLESGIPVVLYQGSIQEHRGIEAAIDAVAVLDEVALVVIGYGHHRPVLERMVRRRGLEDRVRFFGPVDNERLLRYTASADIGLCTIVSSSLSYHTSLPNKLFEYFMAGIPVLGSEAPEIARVVTETGAGLVVSATDAAAIAAAITGILADPEPHRAAAIEAGKRYHWGAEARVLLDVYRRLEAS